MDKPEQIREIIYSYTKDLNIRKPRLIDFPYSPHMFYSSLIDYQIEVWGKLYKDPQMIDEIKGVYPDCIIYKKGIRGD